MVGLKLLVLQILTLFSWVVETEEQNLNVTEYHLYMYNEIKKWITEYEWMSLGRNFCSCEKFKSERFCEALNNKNQIKCLDGPRGSKLLVKTYGSDAEIQAKYDPTPSRGISFIRFYGHYDLIQKLLKVFQGFPGNRFSNLEKKKKWQY